MLTNMIMFLHRLQMEKAAIRLLEQKHRIPADSKGKCESLFTSTNNTHLVLPWWGVYCNPAIALDSLSNHHQMTK